MSGLRDPETSFQASWESRNLRKTHLLPNLFLRPALPSSEVSMSGTAISGGQELKNQTNKSKPWNLFPFDCCSQEKTCHINVGLESREGPPKQDRTKQGEQLQSAHLSLGRLGPGVVEREPKLLNNTGCRKQLPSGLTLTLPRQTSDQ